MVLVGIALKRLISENMRLVKLPPYTPELNPVEYLCDELRGKYFHNRVFESIEALENHLSASLLKMEQNHLFVHSIVDWPWIINSL
jgi:transposase